MDPLQKQWLTIGGIAVGAAALGFSVPSHPTLPQYGLLKATYHRTAAAPAEDDVLSDAVDDGRTPNEAAITTTLGGSVATVRTAEVPGPGQTASPVQPRTPREALPVQRVALSAGLPVPKQTTSSGAVWTSAEGVVTQAAPDSVNAPGTARAASRPSSIAMNRSGGGVGSLSQIGGERHAGLGATDQRTAAGIVAAMRNAIQPHGAANGTLLAQANGPLTDMNGTGGTGGPGGSTGGPTGVPGGGGAPTATGKPVDDGKSENEKGGKPAKDPKVEAAVRQDAAKGGGALANPETGEPVGVEPAQPAPDDEKLNPAGTPSDRTLTPPKDKDSDFMRDFYPKFKAKFPDCEPLDYHIYRQSAMCHGQSRAMDLMSIKCAPKGGDKGAIHKATESGQSSGPFADIAHGIGMSSLWWQCASYANGAQKANMDKTLCHKDHVHVSQRCDCRHTGQLSCI